jgi:hypothetical protein
LTRPLSSSIRTIARRIRRSCRGEGQGFRYALGVQDVKGVVANARQQRPAIDTLGLLQAMQHYYDHDAYPVL